MKSSLAENNCSHSNRVTFKGVPTHEITEAAVIAGRKRWAGFRIEQDKGNTGIIRIYDESTDRNIGSVRLKSNFNVDRAVCLDCEKTWEPLEFKVEELLLSVEEKIEKYKAAQKIIQRGRAIWEKKQGTRPWEN